MVVPNWPNQPWYPLFTKMLIKDPVVFDGTKVHKLFTDRDQANNIQEANFIAGLVSGNPSWTEVYQKRLQKYSWTH